MFATSLHTPVLLSEVLAYLNPQPEQIFVDATLGLGGHAEALLQRIGPTGRLLAFEQDPRNLELAQARLSAYRAQVEFIPENFVHFAAALTARKVSQVDGILFDLGISSRHFDDATRGFSLRLDGPLDMRLNPRKNSATAADLINESPVEELERIFREYGEEPRAKFLARKITEARQEKPFLTTAELKDFIVSLSFKSKKYGGGHPATLVFQALRIAVNDELNVLRQTLPQTLPFLKKGARIVIIAFHSLEDRIAKEFLLAYTPRKKIQKYPRGPLKIPDLPLQILTAKPLTPSAAEVAHNPRARSARLRAAEKVF